MGSVVEVSRLWSTGSIAVVHRLSCSTSCGILPNWTRNPCLLHWQADSLLLSHQGNPHFFFFSIFKVLNEFFRILLLYHIFVFLFIFFFFCHKACGILVPQPGFKPTSPELKGEVLTTKLPGKPSFPLLERPPVPSDYGPTLMISFYLNYHLKAYLQM